MLKYTLIYFVEAVHNCSEIYHAVMEANKQEITRDEYVKEMG